MTKCDIQQLKLLKSKSPVERFLIMAQLIDDQLSVMKAGLKYSNPNMNDEELEKCFKNRMRKIYSLKH